MKKLFLALAALVMAFTATAAEPNIYASGLKAGAVTDGKVEISYLLNATATSLELQLIGADNAVAQTITLSDAALLSKGAHTTIVDLANVAAGTYTWAIKAGAAERTAVSENIIAVGEYDFYRPQGFAVNTNTESPFFGTVYISNAAATSNTTKYEGAAKGVYVFNPLYELQGSYDGGVTWGSPSPFRLFIDENDLVYASNWGTEGGIYIMDPANPTAAFKSLFEPAKRGETYSQITGFDIVGTGADRVLVACDGVTYDTNLGQLGAVVKFAIGETTENFAGAVDTLGTAKKFTLANNNNNVLADGRGGWWIYQNRGSEATSATGFQCLVHITADGELNYGSYTDGLGITGSPEGAAALNADKTILAIAVAGAKIAFYDITWGEDGKPALTKKTWESPVLGNKINGIAWDYANNLVTGTRNTERLGVFALPSENICTTPAPKANTITIEAVPTELWLTPNSGEITAGGDYFQITANFDVELTEDQLLENLKWSASHDGISFMGVNPVMVSASADVPAGQVTITATYGGLEMTGYYAVVKPGPQGISITPAEGLEIESLGTLQLGVELYPEDAETEIIWTSSNDELATVSATGLVTSLVTDEEATVTITAAASGYEGIEASVNIKLLAKPAEPTTQTLYCKMEHEWWTTSGAAIGCYYWDVEGAPTWPGIRMTAVEGETGLWSIEIPASVGTVIFTRMNPQDGDNQDWGARTADLVIPAGQNCYTITSETATWGGSNPVSGTWSIYPAPAAQPTQMWLTPNWGEINPGGELFAVSVNFDAEVTEEDFIAGREIVLSRPDEGIMVMGGKSLSIYVPGDVADGQLTVTVKYAGLEAQGVYNIVSASTEPQAIFFNNTPSEYTIESLGTLQLNAEIYPANPALGIIWESSDETLATVSTTGLVTSLVTEAEATVTIKATVEGYPTVFVEQEITLLAAEAPEYYLIGYIDGANYGCEEDYDNTGDYKFTGEPLQTTATFKETSYVFVKTGDNKNWYMTQAYVAPGSATTAILANTQTGNCEKLGVPAGTWVFTLIENTDGTLTLSYVAQSPSTALENANAEQDNVRKVIENGQLIIIKDGVRYNAQGAVIE